MTAETKQRIELEFVPVNTQEKRETLARCAHDIWFEYWPNIIGEDQTSYMVKNFQSIDAIRRDMDEHNYEYWLLYSKEEGSTKKLVGYTGGCEEKDTNRFFISKIYLYQQERGKGFASQTIAFYNGLCKTRHLRAMYLTVNKQNELGIRAYKGKGFETLEAVATDIGGGFIMDDYVMERPVS